MDCRIKTTALREIIEECDCNKFYYANFEEFCEITLEFIIKFEDEGKKDQIKK